MSLRGAKSGLSVDTREPLFDPSDETARHCPLCLRNTHFDQFGPFFAAALAGISSSPLLSWLLCVLPSSSVDRVVLEAISLIHTGWQKSVVTDRYPGACSTLGNFFFTNCTKSLSANDSVPLSREQAWMERRILNDGHWWIFLQLKKQNLARLGGRLMTASQDLWLEAMKAHAKRNSNFKIRIWKWTQRWFSVNCKFITCLKTKRWINIFVRTRKFH